MTYSSEDKNCNDFITEEELDELLQQYDLPDTLLTEEEEMLQDIAFQQWIDNLRQGEEDV